MQRHVASALDLARWLERQPQVARVHYPGLESHPQHALAKRQMSGRFGGMISLDLRTDLAGTRRFLEAVRIFALAESLGGVESLIEHPAIMTHATIPADTRRRLGIGDALVRLSVGVEGRRGPARRPEEGARDDLNRALWIAIPAPIRMGTDKGIE
jgi:cystathionine gamma-lyase